MSKYILLLFAFVLSTLSLYAYTAPEEESPSSIKDLPANFTINGYYMLDEARFDLESTERHFGHIMRGFNQTRPEWLLFYYDGRLHARATTKFFSENSQIDITTANGVKLGSIKSRFFVLTPTYDIVAPNGAKLGVLNVNFWGTHATLTEPNGQTVVTMHRPYFAWGDEWTVSIDDPEILDQLKLDSRLLITGIVFQTDREWKTRRALMSTLWKSLELGGKYLDYLEKQKKLEQNKSGKAILPNSDKQIAEGDAYTPSEVENPAEIPEVMEETEVLNEMRDVSGKLSKYSVEFKGVIPTPEDFEKAQQVVDEHVQNLEEAYEEEAATTPIKEKTLPETQRVVNGLRLLEPLFESDELTKGQKAALLLMMHKLLNETD